MSKWCDVCNREPYRGCDSSCPIFGLSFSELAKKYFQDNIDTSKREIKMNLHERAEMVRAMDKIARSINDENVFETWLVSDVADGDIDESTTDEELMDYCSDDEFADLMDTFLHVMARAYKSGGLYFDNIVVWAM